MSGEYRRIQVYFPVHEVKLYRAIEALARKQGVSKSRAALNALREWLNTEEVADQVVEAVSDGKALEYIQGKDPCRHRTFDGIGKLTCRVNPGPMKAARCVECEDYEPR